MRRTLKLLATTATLVVIGSPQLAAQRRPAPTTATAPSTKSGGSSTAGRPTKSPSYAILAGIASGPGGFDLGFAVAATATLAMPQWPVDIRIDPYFAHHSVSVGSESVSLNLIGVGGAAQFVFPTSSALAPYVFGGVGIYHSGVSLGSGFTGTYGTASSTDLGFSVGGGVNFGKNFLAEVRWLNFNGGSTIPILVGLRF